MLSAVIKVAIMFAIMSQIVCFDANLIFNLKSIDKGPTLVSATFNILKLKNIPFNVFDHAKMSMIESVNPRNRSQKQYSLIINLNDQVFNATTSGLHFEINPMTREYLSVLEFEFGDILNTIFKCYNLSSIYVSKFIYLDSEPDESAKTIDPINPGVPFLKNIYMFWVITWKNQTKYNNDIIYTKFLEDCHQNSHNYVVILFGTIIIIIACGAMISFLHRFLCKRKIYPM